MLKSLFIVGAGGFLGSTARYLAAVLMSRNTDSTFPYSTFIVNITGCLLIGLVYGCGEKYSWLTPEWRLFLATGFCGGYTTFSAFAYENTSLLHKADYLTFATYSVLSFAVGLLAVGVGLAAIKLFSN